MNISWILPDFLFYYCTSSTMGEHKFPTCMKHVPTNCTVYITPTCTVYTHILKHEAHSLLDILYSTSQHKQISYLHSNLCLFQSAVWPIQLVRHTFTCNMHYLTFVPHLPHKGTTFVPHLPHIYKHNICSSPGPCRHHLCSSTAPYRHHLCSSPVNIGTTFVPHLWL